jgi:hypothetical protein
MSTLFSGDSSRDALAIALYFGGAGLGMVLTGLLIPLILVLGGLAADLVAVGWIERAGDDTGRARPTLPSPYESGLGLGSRLFEATFAFTVVTAR